MSFLLNGFGLGPSAGQFGGCPYQENSLLQTSVELQRQLLLAQANWFSVQEREFVAHMKHKAPGWFVPASEWEKIP